MTLAQLRAHSGDAAERLSLLENEVISDCESCKLHRGRTQLVFGTGNPNAELVFVSVGPGAEEDRQGAPVIGAGGAMLDNMLGAMDLKREDVYICTLVKCRSPNNREPEPDEVHACEPFLRAQIGLVKPKVIVTLGRPAAQILLRKKETLLDIHGQWFRYQGIDLLPSFDPSYLLRETKYKRAAWEDLKKVMQHLGLQAPQKR
ncbi:MAG: uracil-DNA glycosylase [Deltaproteobacteria bacterium]|nr:uracil-DNA glycosylase [Deltaproteobacteria bacterium]